MAEYYVIKDKNTGLYFRGKGVNRWGKYYNQASIYRFKGTVASVVWEMSKSDNGEEPEIVPIKIFEDADVVQVVRCKDCTHWGDTSCQIKVSQYGLEPDDFCSYGEREEND